LYRYGARKSSIRDLRSVRPGPQRMPVVEEEATDYGSLLKEDVVKIADERGVDSSGTKAEIIERLEQADG
jgi:hypothetical protein